MGNIESKNEEIHKKIDNDVKKKKKRVKKKVKNVSKDFDISVLDFDNDYNAYNVLQLEDGCNDINQLKSNYYKLALKYHPDKNNGEFLDHFLVIKEAYKYLKEKMEKENYYETKTQQDVVRQEYNVREFDSNRKNVHLDAKNFNNDKFNEVFNDNRMFNPYDRGYGDLKEDEDELIRGENINGFQINNFNDSFNKVKKRATNNQIINYHGPEANYNTRLNFDELGVDTIDDFGVDNKFTDYRKAYGSKSVLIDENDISQRRSYKNLSEYKNERSNLNLSAEQLDKIKLKEEQEKLMEMERLEKQKKYDKMVENNFNRLNSYLIIDNPNIIH